MKKVLKSLLVIVVSLVLILLAVNIFDIPNDYISFTRVVEKVEKRDQNVYFEFYDDYKEQNVHNIYSFYEYGDVKADYVMDNIKTGDFI